MNLDEIAVELLQTMDVEENGAQVGNIHRENFPLATVVMDDKPPTRVGLPGAGANRFRPTAGGVCP